MIFFYLVKFAVVFEFDLWGMTFSSLMICRACMLCIIINMGLQRYLCTVSLVLSGNQLLHSLLMEKTNCVSIIAKECELTSHKSIHIQLCPTTMVCQSWAEYLMISGWVVWIQYWCLNCTHILMSPQGYSTKPLNIDRQQQQYKWMFVFGTTYMHANPYILVLLNHKFEQDRLAAWNFIPHNFSMFSTGMYFF